jgi:hypothetical protein
VGPFDLRHGLAPGGISWLGHEWKVLQTLWLKRLAVQPAASRGVPDGDVKRELPDAMNVTQRFGRSRRRIHIPQQFKQRWAMPGVAVEGSAKLLGDKGGL